MPGQLWQWLLYRVWYVYPDHVLFIKAAPVVCLETLTRAARPSVQRLHLRNLFAEGRRYHILPGADHCHFQMKSTTRIPWRRQRSRSASVLYGSCQALTADITRVDLRVRVALPFFLDIFLLPAWMSLLLVFGPLSLPVGLAASALILVLSWLWHRYTAVLQAMDMVYFVQVALDDLPEATFAELPRTTDNIIYSEFEQQWRKFYDEQSHEQP